MAPSSDAGSDVWGARPLPELDLAWSYLAGGARHTAVERRAPQLRDRIRSSGTVLAVRTLDIADFPYPTRYAFSGSARLLNPFVWMRNRALLIEFRALDGRRRRLLANPTDADASRAARYFQDLTRYIPAPVERWMSRARPPLPEQLRALGVDPGSIDAITFDHLHVQDLRPLLGPRGHYPNARLYLTVAEQRILAELHPLQRYWYIPGALDGADDRLVVFDRDLLLGEGLALVRTPGHTAGNHSIVVALPDGLVAVSENGIAADCYHPEASRIPGLAEHARSSGEAAILNGNTREQTLDQYTSMRLEALLAEAPGAAFPRVFPSSELVAHPLAPGLVPTHAVGSLSHGTLASA
jgi:hypothetical protein